MQPHLEALAKKASAHYKWMKELWVERKPKEKPSDAFLDDYNRTHRGGGDGNPLTPLMDAYAEAHPDADVWELKAMQYRVLAEHMETIIYEESPFYFVNDMCYRDGKAIFSAGGWLENRNRHLYNDADPKTFDLFNRHKGLQLYSCCGPYADELHFCFPVGNVIRMGMKGAYEKLQAAKKGASAEELKFLETAEVGLLSAKRVAERFAQAAKERRASLTDPKQQRNMDLLISAAEHAPWEPCEHFLEGLNTIWFCRDIMGVMDGIGNSHLGRPDYQLIDLYHKDIADGTLTEEEALDLVRQFILLGDMHYDKTVQVHDWADHEEEMGLVLGGCNSRGEPVFNEVTKLFLQAHRDVNAIYPKLHCRFGSNSPKEYLDALSREFVSGRSVLGLSNDDGYIPALLHDGLSLEDARGYVNTGCWSAISEGNESVPGGNYFYMITMLEQSVYGPEKEFIDAGFSFTPLDNARNFEELYRILLGNFKMVMDFRNRVIGIYGRLASTVNPLTLCSCFMNDCIENRKDFTQGGCRYNRNTVDPNGFANVIDALLAIKKLCFDEKTISLHDYLDAVRRNWEGAEELLYQVRHCPHFGDFSSQSVELSQRLHYDLYENARKFTNERGGKYSLNYIVYREFLLMAKSHRATPDGRRNGELFALGIGPSRYHPADSLTEMVQSAGALQPELVNVSALDLQLPLGQTNVPRLSMLFKAFTQTGIKHLQINVVNVEDLRDAQIHPERHADIIVRVCGFSAKFVTLAPVFQEEIIHRFLYQN